MSESEFEENLERQEDEIAVLSAIFSTDVDTTQYSPPSSASAVSGVVVLTVPVQPVAASSGTDASWAASVGPLTAEVVLPGEYPAALAPTLLSLSAPWGEAHEMAEISDELYDAAEDEAGEVCLHLWMETLRDAVFRLLPVIRIRVAPRDPGVPLTSPKPGDGNPAFAENAHMEIVTGDSMRRKKSKFVAHAARVRSLKDVELMMGLLMGESRIAKATHNIMAYRFRPADNGPLNEGRDDDGEHGAADQMLRILQSLGSINVAVIVTRWYGGVHLGPERFKIINNLTRDILLESGMYDTSLVPDSTAPDSSDPADPNNPTKSSSSSSSKPSSGSTSSKYEKKRKLRTSADIYNRIVHDPALNSEEFEIGYLDRFTGEEIVPFNDFTTEDVYEYEGIPMHRVVRFLHNGKVIWDRSARLDLLFGSGDTESATYGTTEAQ